MKSNKSEELTIFKKGYDLALYVVPLVERMPRGHRFTLGDRIVGRVYEFLEVITMARYSNPKIALLRQGNLLLERLRLLLRLAKDLQAVSVKGYGHAGGLVDEVGMMLGGWIKSQERVGP